MLKIIKFSFFLLFALALVACQEAEPLAFEEVCQPGNNQKNVMVDGYFSLGASVYCSDVSGERRCGLVFNRFPDGEMEFSADVLEGRRRNHMVPLESGYLEEDLQIKTADGSFIGVGDHVNITGELLVSDNVCVIYVDRIETLED